MRRITIDGEFAHRSNNSASHHTYIVTFSEPQVPMTSGPFFRKFVLGLVKVASGLEEQVVENSQALQHPGQPYVSKLEQLSPTQWVVTITMDWTD